MKITHSEIIKNGEQELIEAITADLDWGAIEEIFLKEHNLGIEEDITYKRGDIVAVDNQIAYKLEFELKINLSVLLNRNGEYLSINISNRKESPDGSADIDLITEESAPGDNVDLHGTGQYMDASGNTTEINGKTDNDVDKSREGISNESDAAPFGDLSADSSDDLGEKVDNILENIQKAD